MKQLIFFITALLLLFTMSCSKSKDNNNNTPGSGYYLRFKLNGVQKDYPMSTIEVDDVIAGVYGSTISGADPSNLTTIFNIMLLDNTALHTGTYNQAVIPGTYHTRGQLNYIDNGNSYSSISLVLNPAATATINITEISATAVKGTFSGTLYDATGPYTAVTHTITEGVFYSKRN